MRNIIETIKLKIQEIMGEEEERVQDLINYKEEWVRISQECDRINNLFQYDDSNTFKYIDHLNHLEQIRFHLKKIIDSGLDSLTSNYKQSNNKTLEITRKETLKNMNRGES